MTLKFRSLSQKIAFIFLATLLLTQCSYTPVLNAPPSVVPEAQRAAMWTKNQTSLNKLRSQRNWNMLARVGLVSKDGSTSSQLDWINTSNNGYHITLNNMLTFGRIEIIKNKAVTLSYQDKVYSASNPEELLFKLTNLKLPISQLEYWFLGLPSPNLPLSHTELNQYALLNRLNQGAYTISYDEYNKVNNFYLPHKITIKAPKVYIKVNVQSWDLQN